MATKTTCDGTGVEIPDDTPAIGHFGRQYSAGCQPVAMEYLAKLDELHTAAALQFQAELDALREKYRIQLRRLPDEP